MKLIVFGVSYSSNVTPRDVRSRMTSSMSSTSKCATVWPTFGCPRRIPSCVPFPAPHRKENCVSSSSCHGHRVSKHSHSLVFRRAISRGAPGEPVTRKRYAASYAVRAIIAAIASASKARIVVVRTLPAAPSASANAVIDSPSGNSVIATRS